MTNHFSVVPGQMDLISRPVTQSAQAATERLSNGEIEERGAIFTRREVVDFVLDLVGYTSNETLHRLRILEPSFGAGDFLLPIVDRLLGSYRRSVKVSRNVVEDLSPAVRGVELHRDTFSATRRRLAVLLEANGIGEDETENILSSWLSHGDFLLEPMAAEFSHVVGNPPYIRQELIPDALMAEYRSRFQTIYDRADIYVPFIEKSLFLLKPGGTLGFICSDRWMKNRYGGLLRRLIAERFHLKFIIDMVNTPAFHSDVIAYPAITVIQNEDAGVTRVARRPGIERNALSALAQALIEGNDSSDQVKEISGVARGMDPWILESDQLAVVRRLESQFPTIEEARCKVGIGVATGADSAFIGIYDDLDVEPDRKLPLVMTRDILTGKVDWRGYGVVNPFSNNGGLVSLVEYPKLAAHLNRHSDDIRKRHVSRKNPGNWYRTIDRIYPGLAKKPKLLIPDIKGEASIVYENGTYYPHHNLYFITSDVWDLRALQSVLKSGIAKLFISTYSTRMRGGYLRFQAQYLRRIRLPFWEDVDARTRAALIASAESEDVSIRNATVSEMYSLTDTERAAIGADGE